MKEGEVYKLLEKHSIAHPEYKIFKLNEKLSFDKFPCVLKNPLRQSYPQKRCRRSNYRYKKQQKSKRSKKENN